MPSTTSKKPNPLRVIHCFRSPVGGVFRHVCDLVRGQNRQGLEIGIVCDSSTGGRFADTTLDQLAPLCALGIHRLPMNRGLHWSDITAPNKIYKLCRPSAPAIIHGHGAKGGAWARLVAKRLNAEAIYTPHGGSLHYNPTSLAGRLYLWLERFLKDRTDGFIFESKFSADTYTRKIGTISTPYQLIHNGLYDREFIPVTSSEHRKNFVFIGELRKFKGIEVLLEATARLRTQCEITLLIAGDGPDADFLKRRIHELGLQDIITLLPPIHPATRAFAQARCVITPSLDESFPYIVLEAAAAKMPILTTRVGGIPEIFGPYAHHLLPPNNPEALADAMLSVIENPQNAEHSAELLYDYVKSHFHINTMVDATLNFYQKVLQPA